MPRHAAVLGLTALLHTSPYDVPAFMPMALASLARCNNDVAPVNATVRKAFGDFWRHYHPALRMKTGHGTGSFPKPNCFPRTHQESWDEYRERFTEEELEYVSEMIAPGASYYA